MAATCAGNVKRRNVATRLSLRAPDWVQTKSWHEAARMALAQTAVAAEGSAKRKI